MDSTGTTVQSKIVGAGGLIRKLRTDAGMSAAKLGQGIGVTRSMIIHIESDRRGLSVPMIELIADKLDPPMNREALVLACLKTAYPQMTNTRLGRRLSLIVDALGEIDE